MSLLQEMQQHGLADCEFNRKLTGDQTMKTSELTGAALDWAVGQATGFQGDWLPDYSTDWAHGGLIIECEIIGLDYDAADGWQARDFDTQQITATGKTPLVAAMRCYVASKLGDEVEVPEALINYA